MTRLCKQQTNLSYRNNAKSLPVLAYWSMEVQREKATKLKLNSLLSVTALWLRPYVYEVNTIKLVWTKITGLLKDNCAMEGTSFQALHFTEHAVSMTYSVMKKDWEGFGCHARKIRNWLLEKNKTVCDTIDHGSSTRGPLLVFCVPRPHF